MPVAVVGGLLAAPAAGAGLHLEHVSVERVSEIRSGYKPALAVRVSGLADPDETVKVSLIRGGCAHGARDQAARSPRRARTFQALGPFDREVKMARIPRGLWSGHVCADLERRGGGTAARAGRGYRIATYRNPVYPTSFPDPMVMVLDVGAHHRDYYAYATGNRFPILRSPDLVHWRAAGHAFTSRPDWVVREGDWRPWAPSVLERDSPCPGAHFGHCFILYYGGQSAKFGISCIGVATARSPGGPFTDRGILREGSGAPVGCRDARGYSEIDADPFVDRDGRGYLYLSTGARCQPTGAGRSCHWQPTISVLRLSRDWLHAVGRRVALFSGDPGTWEQAPWGPVVEGPWMLYRGGTYFLFYSGGAWTGRYGMGYASSSSPLGPFVKARSNPLLTDSASVRSVGGGSLVTGPSGGTWVVYHGRSGSYSAPRLMRIDRVRWGLHGRPSIDGPTVTPQAPVP